MSVMRTLKVHQCDDVKFTNINLLNAKLYQTNICELVDFSPMPSKNQYNGFLRLQDGQLKIASRGEVTEFDGYKDFAPVWGSFGEQEVQMIADNLQTGKIVFYMEVEGNTDYYLVLTPGQVENIQQTTLKF